MEAQMQRATAQGSEKNSSTQGLRALLGRRAAAVGFAVALVLGTAGCGLVKTGYRNGDTVGLFMINRYLDLSGEQKEYVKPKLRALLAWHRATQLPDYAAFATELQKFSSRTITPADVETLGDQARKRAYTTIDHALPDVADIALRLTSANIKALQAKFVDDDEKWSGDHLKGDLEKRQQVRYEKTLERVEEWYGRFSGEQRQAIRRASDARPLDNGILFAERQRREQQLVALLKRVEAEKPSRETVVALMKTYAERFEQSPEADRRAFVDALHRTTDEMNATIHNLATPQQRARAATKLQEWIDDFRSLSVEAGRT